MNYLYQATFLLCFLATACQNTISSLSTPEHVRLGNQEIASFAKEVKATTQLQILGTGGGFLDKINIISFTFSSKEAPTVEEARMLFYEIATRFLSRINQNEAIRPYLVKYPFTIENLKLVILFFGNKPGSISGVSFTPPYEFIKRPSFVYYSTDNLKTQHMEVIFQETYEEGLERFEQQKKEQQSKQ